MAANPNNIKPPTPTVLPDRTVAIRPTIRKVDNSPAPPPTGKQRADFRPQDFTRVLHQHGKFVVWRKAILCPCTNQTTLQTTLDCSRCDGNGYVHVDPIRVRGHMAAFDKREKIYEKFGMWVEGACAITVDAQYRLNYRDQIQLEDALMPFNELLKKGNRRGIRSTLPAGVDSARYRIEAITNLMYCPDPNGALVSLDIGTHFEVTKDGWIRWLTAGNQAIADGTMFSVRYDFHPVYQVVSHPHVLRDDVRGTKVPQDTVESLPIQAALKLEYLVNVNNPVPSSDC